GRGDGGAIKSARLGGRAGLCGVAQRPSHGQSILPRTTPARATGCRLPNEFRYGIAIDPIAELTLELDYKYTNWSVLHALNVKFRGVHGELIQQPFRFDFRDASYVGFGMEYRIKSLLEGLGLRAGVYWDESP